jgi:hypothetical protein
VFLKIFAVAALAALLLVGAREGRLPFTEGLVGRCTEITAPAGDAAQWQACRAGKLEGRPTLERRSCVSTGVVDEVEYWRCPADVVVERAS